MADPTVAQASFSVGDRKSVSIEMYKAANGIVIDHGYSADFDHRKTIMMLPTNGNSKIIHEEKKMLPHYRYEFQVGNLGELASLANTITERGSFQGDEARQLSTLVTSAVAACKQGSLGRTLSSQGGWREALDKFSRTSTPNKR